MTEEESEDRLLRDVAIKNANAILAARQRAEDELRRAKEALEIKTRELERAHALKDEFLAMLSHELRTPLNAILGWAQMLRLPTPSQTDLRRGLEVIERNVRAQMQLIEDLLDMSRIASGKLRLDSQPVMPATFVEPALETVRAAADAKGIRLSVEIEPSLGPVNGDAGRLEQVVWNLLSNAIKFTGDGGEVAVRVKRADRYADISVRDTGIGIAPEFLPFVFDRFRQADASIGRAAGGLGLGLAIVKELIELHGGSVNAASPGVGAGATFSVLVPLARAGEQAPREPACAAGGRPLGVERFDLRGIDVLVVDDEVDTRDLIARILRECGARVHAVESAEEALPTIERVRPHVLVSDIGLPNVDGYQLLRQVRELGLARGGGLPAIALTAFARSEDRTRALLAGYVVHVSKPVEPAELAATVASVVGRMGDPIAG